jgi:hypothetical protein
VAVTDLSPAAVAAIVVVALVVLSWIATTLIPRLRRRPDAHGPSGGERPGPYDGPAPRPRPGVNDRYGWHDPAGYSDGPGPSPTDMGADECRC